MPEPIIQIENLRKTYNDLVAIDNLSLQINQGEVFGLLGPNGAGKTTTVEIMECLRQADQGNARILNHTIPAQIDAIKPKLGVQLQSTDLPDLIRVKELLTLFASYYPNSLPVDKLLIDIALDDKKNALIKELSGGQKQRLTLALALVSDPQLLILDEPTTGLDPQARRMIWSIIENHKKSGKTILLTTHYMEEAEQLCDRVGIIDHGKIIALGSPQELIQKQNLATTIEFELKPEVEFVDVHQFPEVEEVFQEDRHVTLHSKHPQKLLIKLVRALDQGSLPIQQISLRRASLEDVFLELTGRKIRE